MSGMHSQRFSFFGRRGYPDGNGRLRLNRGNLFARLIIQEFLIDPVGGKTGKISRKMKPFEEICSGYGAKIFPVS